MIFMIIKSSLFFKLNYLLDKSFLKSLYIFSLILCLAGIGLTLVILSEKTLTPDNLKLTDNIISKIESNILFVENYVFPFYNVFLPFLLVYAFIRTQEFLIPGLLKELKNHIAKEYENKYDLNFFNYKKSKVSLFCPIHGEFTNSLNEIMNNVDCKLCIQNDLFDKKSNSKILKSQSLIQEDLKEIKKDGKDTKDIVLKIDRNVESLIRIEKIKLKFGSKDEEKCIDEILSFIEKKVEFNDINLYKDIVIKWFKSWDKLEPLSQEFMSQSEFLYDSIQKSKFTDFSPFILYYCRVLEYELLNKIFIKYHDFLAKNHIDKEKLFEFEPKGLKKSTIKDLESGMMKFFKLKVIKNDAKYTLGEMRLILNILPTKTKPQGSERYKALKALQELNYFINDNIGNIESEIIVKIENIIKKYRNPSAHIGTINKESADEFYSIYKTTMNDLFDSFH